MRYINATILGPDGSQLPVDTMVAVSAWDDFHVWRASGHMSDNGRLTFDVPQEVAALNGWNYSVIVPGMQEVVSRALTPPTNDGANTELFNPETGQPDIIQLKAGSNPFA